ncbi:MAG TPA: hypothetical protein DDW52_17650 [Planctomycetaceae bacterium]|nr:hypothetical protein [Planctomycetaceae bacterium]
MDEKSMVQALRLVKPSGDVSDLRRLDLDEVDVSSNAHRLLAGHLRMSLHIAWPYLSSIPAERLLARHHPLCNSTNWQIGHLICSEYEQIASIAAKTPGNSSRTSVSSTQSNGPHWHGHFQRIYHKPERESELPACKSPDTLASQADLRFAFEETRQITLALLCRLTARELSEPTTYPYAPTKAAVFQMVAAHWLLHSAQWP